MTKEIFGDQKDHHGRLLPPADIRSASARLLCSKPCRRPLCAPWQLKHKEAFEAGATWRSLRKEDDP